MMAAGRKQKKIGVLKICDKAESSLTMLKCLEKTIEKERKIVDNTIKFWDIHSSTPKLSSLRDSKRRVILSSKDVPISLASSGSFHKNWIILMNDVLVHVYYSTISIHPLRTIWIVSHQEGKPEIELVMPEETLTLVATEPENKSEWFGTLQKAMIDSLRSGKDSAKLGSTTSFTSPIVRSTSYTFKKNSDLKGAEYTGSWVHGKMQGEGRIIWPDGRVYTGQLWQNQVMEIKNELKKLAF
jgi:hypothetical protein